MRATPWAMGIAVVLTGTISLTRGDDTGYELRGPSPTAGQIVISMTTMKIDQAEMAIKAGNQNIKATQTLTSTDEQEIKYLAVKDRQVTKVQTKIIREKVQTVVNLGGMDKKESKSGDLEGEIIISERTGPAKWKHTLIDTRPTDKQKSELEKRLGPENQDELYPAGQVKIGHTWTVDATALQRMFGGSITNLKGKLQMKLVKTESVNGEPCAVIESAGKITGVTKEDESTLDVELDLKGTTWRSIQTGLDVKDKAEGRIKMSGQIKMDGVDLGLTLEGPLTITASSKFKSSKAD